MNLSESRGKKLCRLAVLASTGKDEIDQKNSKQNPPEKEICDISSSNEINLNESPEIVIEDPELRDLIESENFRLADYIVVKDDSLQLDKDENKSIEVQKDSDILCEYSSTKSSVQNTNSEELYDVRPQKDAIENFDLDCVEEYIIDELHTYVAAEETTTENCETTQLESEALGQDNNINNLSNIVVHQHILWFYNLGVHDSSNTGYCYTWVEGQAGRGAQEVGSCLRKHASENITEGTKHLMLWSDSCGGQNRNIKIVLILKSILEDHPTLQDITQHYLVSGHSFLRNDSDFSDIESCLKVQQRLYVPDDYIKVIETCRRKNKLKVLKMNAEDFVGTLNVEKSITNRKKDIKGEQINWLQFKVIQVRKSHPFSIFVKSDFEQTDFVEVNIGKREPQGKKTSRKKAQKQKTRSSKTTVKKSLHSPVWPANKASELGSPRSSSSDKNNFFSGKLMPLWPQGKPISAEKLADLRSMCHLIPKDCLQFYKKLTSCESIIDDIEGFSGDLDFVLEDVQ